MPATATDRLFGLTTSVAVKAPCRTVATSNITLSGLQTVNGVTVVEDDRVLVTAQTSSVNNGIYLASTGTWRRAPDFDGARDAVQGTQIPITRNGSQTALYEVATANPITIGTTAIVFTLRYSANLQYDVTPGEIAALVTVVNDNYVPGYVDRYKTNASSGTTDMVDAFNAAYQVAKQTGCSVRWGATAPYRLNSPVNCTGMRGVVSYDESSKNLSADQPSIIIAHDGQTYSHGFDLSTSTEMTFNDCVISNLAGKVPNCAFFMARNAAGSGAGMHKFNRVRSGAHSKFLTFFYNYASEENNVNDCVVINEQPGSAIAVHTTTNSSAFTSSFVTIATGDKSNVKHTYRGCEFFQQGNAGGTVNEVIFQIEGAGDLSITDGLFYCPDGLAYVNFNGAYASSSIDITNIRGEVGDTVRYGIYVQTTGTTGATSHVNWTLKNFRAHASNEFLRLVDTAEIQNLDITVCGATSGLLLSAYHMSYSRIMHGTSTIEGRAGGTIQKNTFIGSRAQISFGGTDSLNTGFDQELGRTWESGDSYTAPSTACTGAITTAVIWSLTKFNRKVTVSLPAIAATATAATNFVFGAVLPAAYRPATDLRRPIIILDNGASPNQLGMVVVTASTGVMTVFKDVLGTANFSTTASAEGLPGVTEVSWTV